MQGRTPSKGEKVYINAAKRIGCVACRKLGRDTDGLEDYVAFHHNPEKGSLKPLAHFFGYALCPYHHQGVIPPGCEDPKEPVRHKNYDEYTKAFGSDIACAQYVWQNLSLSEEDLIYEAVELEGFDHLIYLDQIHRGNGNGEDQTS
ncbi:TPA: Ref family recombination enhancement nuclease [Photobacterium damselae]